MVSLTQCVLSHTNDTLNTTPSTTGPLTPFVWGRTHECTSEKSELENEGLCTEFVKELNVLVSVPVPSRPTKKSSTHGV